MTILETLPNGITIVEYHPSLAKGIAEMRNVSQDDWGGTSLTQTESKVLAEHESSTMYNIYVALEGDLVVGYCSFGRYYYDANTTYISLLGVRKGYKNKKIGKALVLRCVQRTIELGYPRIDLYTWAGNTAAVPLYKKCGFLWEDRSDSTHLVNFIPTILKTSLFADFFAKADWYNDSTRSLEVSPDGVKENGFEMFEYAWEKDGECLKIGYERTGRNIRKIENNDYKIEMLAPENALAFGASYQTTFNITNKSGAPLNVKIASKNCDNITWDFNFEGEITDAKTLAAPFFVGEIAKPQDPWRVHPSVEALVEINGHAVTFGLGIDSKFPLKVNFVGDVQVHQQGMAYNAYLDMESGLLEDAEITVNIPKSHTTSFSQNTFTVNAAAKGKASVNLTVTTLNMGFEELKLNCSAILKSGQRVDFTVPLHIICRDFTSSFAAETMDYYHLINGPWQIRFEKSADNDAIIDHITQNRKTGAGLMGYFGTPELGKPYDDEFNLIRPNVTMSFDNGVATLYTEFISKKYPGLVVTHIYTLAAVGLATRVTKVENRGETVWDGMWLQDKYNLGIQFDTVFSLNGKIAKNFSKPHIAANIGGLEGVEDERLTENWVFEGSAGITRGYAWPESYKPSTNWGTYLSFEIEMGDLSPGQSFETQPVIFALGLFNNYNDFRNYARQIYNTAIPVPTCPIDVLINNPFVSGDTTTVQIVNNREQELDGDIMINNLKHPFSAGDFNIPIKQSPIQNINVSLLASSYAEHRQYALFSPVGDIQATRDGNVYSINNGCITYNVDPTYGHVCYSLTDAKNQQWLFSKYPNHEALSWFNPFLGGIRLVFNEINPKSLQKEKVTAEFVTINDNLGNTWQGIASTITIAEHEKLKGLTVKSYFLTQPGLPLLSYFFEVENNTGNFWDSSISMLMSAHPSPDETNIYVKAHSKQNNHYHLRMGAEELYFIAFEDSSETTGARSETLYTYHNNKYNHNRNSIWGNNLIPLVIGSGILTSVANGSKFKSSPTFMIIADEPLPREALGSLANIVF